MPKIPAVDKMNLKNSPPQHRMTLVSDKIASLAEQAQIPEESKRFKNMTKPVIAEYIDVASTPALLVQTYRNLETQPFLFLKTQRHTVFAPRYTDTWKEVTRSFIQRSKELLMSGELNQDDLENTYLALIQELMNVLKTNFRYKHDSDYLSSRFQLELLTHLLKDPLFLPRWNKICKDALHCDCSILLQNAYNDPSKRYVCDPLRNILAIRLYTRSE